MDTQQNINEIIEDQDRSIGKQIFFSKNLEKVIDKITDTSTDVYNDTSLFNTYERLVGRLENLLVGYIDEEYVEERSYIDSLPKTDIYDQVKGLDMRDALCMKLLKRKRFTPPEDVANTSWWIVRDLIDRVNDENDAQVIVSGDRGKGKSTLCLELSEQIATHFKTVFDPAKHLFFNPDNMRKFIYEHRPPPGTPLIWDEAGAGKGMGKRRAMTRESIEYNEIIQVIREMGLIMFYTAPADTKLDSGTIDMFSCHIESVRLDKLEKITLVKYKIRDGKYWKYLTDQNGNRVNRIIIPKASEELIRKYKPLKRDFMYEKVKVKEKEVKQNTHADLDSIKQTILNNLNQYTKMYAGKKIILREAVYINHKKDGITAAEAAELKRRIEAELNG